jgi:hypothetical protein
MLKAAIKHGAGEDKVRHRVVPLETVLKWSDKLAELKDEISEILQEEKEEKHVRHRGFSASNASTDKCFSTKSSVKRRWSSKKGKI